LIAWVRRAACRPFALNEAGGGFCGIALGLSLYWPGFRPALPGLVFVDVMPRIAVWRGFLMPTQG
jgi:hypothetical protein